MPDIHPPPIAWGLMYHSGYDNGDEDHGPFETEAEAEMALDHLKGATQGVRMKWKQKPNGVWSDGYASMQTYPVTIDTIASWRQRLIDQGDGHRLKVWPPSDETDDARDRRLLAAGAPRCGGWGHYCARPAQHPGGCKPKLS